MLRQSLLEVRGSVREFLLLEQAQKRSEQQTATQRDSARAYFQAARRRHHIAQEIRGSDTIVALELYRAAAPLYAAAYLASIDQESGDAGEGDVSWKTHPEKTLDALDTALETGSIATPPAYGAARSFIVSSDMLVFDRLSPEDAEALTERLDAATAWISTLVEARTPATIRRLRWTRVALLGAAVVLVLVAAVSIARFPSNLALHKPVQATAAAYDTTAAGVVDGQLGRFGFHSQEDDAPFLTVDLQKPTKIAKVSVFGRGDCCFDQSIPLELEISEDGASFRPVGQRTTAFSSTNPWVVEMSPVVTRYVSVRAKHRGVLVLGEVEVYGP
jgi:hypothetical protein